MKETHVKVGAKYIVFNTETEKTTVFRFKTTVATYIGVSTMTIDRNKVYKSKKYIVYKVDEVNLKRNVS